MALAFRFFVLLKTKQRGDNLTRMFGTEISRFIDRFVCCANTTDTFQHGCCYWFAFILYERFKSDGASIEYDEISNHFGTRINGVVYDITGDVTSKYKWVPWDSINDETHRNRIVNDCIMF